MTKHDLSIIQDGSLLGSSGGGIQIFEVIERGENFVKATAGHLAGSSRIRIATLYDNGDVEWEEEKEDKECHCQRMSKNVKEKV